MAEVDSETLVAALKVADVKAGNKIIHNLPLKRAYLLIEDLKNRPDSPEASEAAERKILALLQERIRNGIIPDYKK